MKYIEEYLKDVIKVEPLGELTTMDDNLYGMSGEMVYIDGKCSDIFISHADYVTWLEKQGEKKSITNIPSRNVILAIWELGNEWKEITNGRISTEHGTQLNYIQKHWHESDYYLREKQNEQTPVDKVEPKFKVGDWITFTRKDGTREVLQVSDIIDGRYYFNHLLHGSWSVKECDEKCHLWTIQDAKDGDILAAHECIVLFKEIDGLNIKCHCTYHFMINLRFNVNTLQNKSAFHPATKEQRDLLFQKMEEAGYMWDCEKKELKKIEQMSALKEENEYRIKDIIYFLDTAKKHYASTVELDACINWLKSLRTHSTWKPSDEQMQALSDAGNSFRPFEEGHKILWSLYYDLKKLREE